MRFEWYRNLPCAKWYLFSPIVKLSSQRNPLKCVFLFPFCRPKPLKYQKLEWFSQGQIHVHVAEPWLNHVGSISSEFLLPWSRFYSYIIGSISFTTSLYWFSVEWHWNSSGVSNLCWNSRDYNLNPERRTNQDYFPCQAL